MFTFTADWAALIQLFIIPIGFPTIVGLVSNSNWSQLAKRLTLGGLILVGNVVTAVGGSLATGATINVFDLVMQWLLSWGVAELMYWKLYKATITKPVVIETPIETPKVDVDAYTKPQLLSLVEQFTGTLPNSKATKPELAAIIDSNTAIASEVTVVPGKSFADILATKGNKGDQALAA